MRLLSDWLRHRIVKWGEWLLGRFYEGPRTPPRFREEAQLFRAMNPHASPAEWMQFSARLAHNAYTQGFNRGYQWLERDWPGPEIDPEVLAEREREDWSIAENNPALRSVLDRGFNQNDPLAGASKEQIDQLRAAIRAGVAVVDERPDWE